MRIFNLVILLFLMSAFAVGIGIQDEDSGKVNGLINNASLTIQNIELEKSNYYYLDGMFIVVERYIAFIGTFAFEGMRLGINFGQENPEYFEQDFIFKIMRLIIWLTIISLLIQPLFYFGIFIIMGVLWLVELKNKRRKNE